MRDKLSSVNENTWKTNDGGYPAVIRVAKGDHKEELKTRRKKKHEERKINGRICKKGKGLEIPLDS
jgi:hypothetical protein